MQGTTCHIKCGGHLDFHWQFYHSVAVLQRVLVLPDMYDMESADPTAKRKMQCITTYTNDKDFHITSPACVTWGVHVYNGVLAKPLASGRQMLESWESYANYPLCFAIHHLPMAKMRTKIQIMLDACQTECAACPGMGLVLMK